MAPLSPKLNMSRNSPPNRDGNELQWLENEMRSRNIVFRLALRGHSAEFIFGSIASFTAGRSAFATAHGFRYLAPAEIVDSTRPTSSASPPPAHGSRARRHQQRRLDRETAAAARVANEAAPQDRAEQAEAAEQDAKHHRDTETAAQVARRCQEDED